MSPLRCHGTPIAPQPSPEPLSPSPSCRGIATPGTSPGLRAWLWSWPGVHLECRLQVLVPEHFLHQLRINLHLDQDRSERSPESVKSEGAQRGHDFRLVCGHAQVIGDPACWPPTASYL